MQRVSDLPLRVRLPARGPTAVRPSCPALPARPGRRASALRGRVWVGRLGAAACAREVGVCPRGSAAAGGCALHAAGRPADGGRGSPRESSGRSAGGHARAPGPAPTVPKPPRRRPRRRRLARNRPRPRKRSPKRVCAVIRTTVAYNRSHVKKSLTSLFLTSAKILLRVLLAQFHSSKLWPFSASGRNFSTPAFD